MAKSIDDERIYLRTSPSNHIPHGMAYVHAIPLVRERIVTDLCCGTGYGTRLLSEAATHVTGYDYSEVAIEYNNTRPLPNVKYVYADVEKLDTIGGDIITCMQGLEHLDDPKALIQKNLDKIWIFALPNDKDNSNEHHHHKITPELIKDWFGEKVQIRLFDDNGQWINYGQDFTNYFGVYRP